MSDQKSLLNSLQKKGWLDQETLKHLRKRLKQRLEEEEIQQKQELVRLSAEISQIRDQLALYLT